MAKTPRYSPPTMYLMFTFNPACPKCRGLMVTLTDQAVREQRITGWKVTKSSAHLHEIADEDALPVPAPPSPETLFDLPISDTNGFDPPP